MPRYDNAVLPGGKYKTEDPCRRCGGSGRVKKPRINKGKQVVDNIECPRCLGLGKRGFAA